MYEVWQTSCPLLVVPNYVDGFTFTTSLLDAHTQQSLEVNKITFTVSFFLSFHLFKSHCHCCSLRLPPSTCHLYQSLSRLTLTGCLLIALYLLPTNSPAVFGEMASHHHLCITPLPFYPSSSLPPLLLTTPCCSDFKGPGVTRRLNGSLSRSDSLVSLPGVKSV